MEMMDAAGYDTGDGKVGLCKPDASTVSICSLYTIEKKILGEARILSSSTWIAGITAIIS